MILYTRAEGMLTIIVMACIIVFLAMMLDLASGLYKAKQRGEIRTSWGLKRTISKFIMYEGSMLIAAGVDVLICASRLVELFHLDVIVGVPVITCLVGVFLLVVEFVSIRETADKKTLKDRKQAANMITKLLENDNMKDILRTAIEESDKSREEVSDAKC